MGEMVISTAAEMSGLDSDNQRAALRKDRITLDDIRLLKQQRSGETVSESDTENASLAAESDVDTLKTAAGSEPKHIQTFCAAYTQEEVETVYREQTELVQQFCISQQAET